MLKQRTQLLMLFVLLSAAAAIFAYVRMDRQRDLALAAERDLQAVHRDLTDIVRARGGERIMVGRLDNSDLNRRLTTAAAQAGIADKLDMIEPGAELHIGSSDYAELPVMLHLKDVTLQQLTMFLHNLAATDPGSRAKSIELQPPDAATPGAAAGGGARPNEELWAAALTIAYLRYSPKEANGQ
jgi:hypothetical protein